VLARAEQQQRQPAQPQQNISILCELHLLLLPLLLLGCLQLGRLPCCTLQPHRAPGLLRV
jgi:hypothetical protein